MNEKDDQAMGESIEELSSILGWQAGSRKKEPPAKEASQKDRTQMLKEKIQEDFKSGRRYTSSNQPDITKPSFDEMKDFDKLNSGERHSFLRRYYAYFLMAYGKDIEEILKQGKTTGKMPKPKADEEKDR